MQLLFDWIYDGRRFVLPLAIILVVIATIGLSKLTVTPDNRVFYGDGNRYFKDFVQFEADYTSNNSILFVLHSDEQLTTPHFAEAIRWLTAESWRISRAIRVDSLATFPYAFANGDDIHVSPILDVVCPAAESCDEGKKSLFDRADLRNRLVNDEMNSTGVLITFSIGIGVIGVIEEITEEIDELKSEFASMYPEIEIVVTGAVPMMSAFAQTSAEDLSTLLPASLIVICLLLYAFLGGAIPTLILVGVGLLSAATTLGIAGWFGHTINNATSIVPLVVFTLVITSSMHVLIHYIRLCHSRMTVADHRSAVRAAVEGNVSPMLVSSATSILSLLSLSFVDSPPLSQLGQLSALGVFIGTLLALIVLPILLALFSRSYESKCSALIQRALNAYARKLERGWSAAGVSMIALTLLAGGLLHIRIDDDFVKYFDTSTQFRQSTDRATELLSGPNHIEVLLTTDSPDGVFSPRYIEYLKNLTLFLRSHALVANATSFYDVLLDLQRVFDRHVDDVQSAEEFAQWYLTYELSLQRGQSTTDYIRTDHQQSRVAVLLKESTSAEIQDLEKAVYDWGSRHGGQFTILVTGENLPVAHLSEMNIRAMVSGIGICIALTAVLIALLTRNYRIGLACLLAATGPVVFGFGAWGYINETVGLASTAIIALTIGVVIDDAVHLVYRFLDGKERLKLGSWQAAAYSVHRVGTAVTTTTIVMLGGLGALLLSPFEINSSFGACTCLIIAIALLFDLLVFPRLLVWSDSQKTQFG